MQQQQLPSAQYWVIKTIIILLLLFQILYSLPTANCYGGDQEALLHLKSQISNDPLGVLNSWNSSTGSHFCTWFGVTCSSSHPRITLLSLNSMGLSGTISPHIGNLTFLMELQLSNNTFHSLIPQQIGLLPRLRKLYLRNNSFTGPIPSYQSHSSNLAIIDLGINDLQGEIPSELGSLPHLLGLFLDANHLTGLIPPLLGNSTSLKVIQMSQNNLTGVIPDTLGNLSNLTNLLLWDNNLSGTIPFSIFNISSLQVLDVGYCTHMGCSCESR